MAYSEEWTEGPWFAALPQHPLFEVLRDDLLEDGGEDKVHKLLVCESRGDLFVWCPPPSCLLTTNLKRLHARREEANVYQRLHPAVLPVTQPVSLSPSPSGQYLALVGEQYVSVLELRRVRGDEGEFNGGLRDSECSTTPIASTVLRAHCLTIQSVTWHSTDSLLLLTSDGALRLFSIAQPEIPQLSLSVLPAAAQTSQTLRLEEEGTIVACALHGDTALLLMERVDVVSINLHIGAQPSPPLPMHPVTEESYTVGGCDMMVLSPSILAIATDSGRVLHCIYITGDEGSDEGMLFIIETISLPSSDDSTANECLRLFQDHQDRHKYCVLNSVGMFQVTLPWINRVEDCASDMTQFVSVPPSTVTQIIACPQDSVMDAVVVSDPMLGSAAVVLFDDGLCTTVELNQTVSYQDVSLFDHTSTEISTAASTEQYYNHISSILRPPAIPSSPISRMGREAPSTQRHCFDFLQQSSLMLRKRYLIPQVQAKTDIIGRVNLLARRKERQFADLMQLEDSVKEQEEMTQTLVTKLECAIHASANLTERVEKILCCLSSCSPILSDAEQDMAKEMKSREQQLHALAQLVDKAKAKVDIGLLRSQQERLNPTLNSNAMSTVLASLEDDGRSIKTMMGAVQHMSSVLVSATD